MRKILHSLPWTLALALAQAGEGGGVPLSFDEAFPPAAESGVSGEGGASSRPYASRPDAEGAESASRN